MRDVSAETGTESPFQTANTWRRIPSSAIQLRFSTDLFCHGPALCRFHVVDSIDYSGVQTFTSWWLSSAQTNVGDTIVGKAMVDKATQHQDEIESRPTTSSTSKGAPLYITPSDPLCVRNAEEATATTATQPGKSETGESDPQFAETVIILRKGCFGI